MALQDVQNALYSLQEEPVSEDLENELDKFIRGYFTVDKEQLDKLGVKESDFMYSMGKHNLLDIARHFANWQKNRMMKDAVNIEYDNLVAYDIIYKICQVLGKGGKGKLIIIKQEEE